MDSAIKSQARLGFGTDHTRSILNESHQLAVPCSLVMKGNVNQSYPKCGLRNRRITWGAHKRLALEFNLVLAVLGLHCCVGLPLVAEREGYMLQSWPLTTVFFLVAEHGL